MAACAEPRRGLEGTGIAAWSDEHTHHLAARAAEIGDISTELTCDEVLAGLTDAGILVSLVESDEDYHDWMLRGADRGWSVR